jgi:deoxyribose-phosphate aldolase
MNQKTLDFISMVDAVAINPRDTVKEVDFLAECAVKYGYHLVFVSQCFTEYIIKKLKGTGVSVGGGIGNSTGVGEEPTGFKIVSAKHWAALGCIELEMFLNVPYLRSGMYDEVRQELKAIREIAPAILKVIINTPLLTDEQIKIACEMIMETGCDYIKTGTGFYGPTTVEAVRIIKETVGDKVKIKASGGVTGLAMIDELKHIGVTRFGLSNTKMVAMIQEIEQT